MISPDWTCIANFLCFLLFLFLILSLYADFRVCLPPAISLFYLVISVLVAVLRASMCVLPCFSTNCMSFWLPVAVWTCMGLDMRSLLAHSGVPGNSWLYDGRPRKASKHRRLSINLLTWKFWTPASTKSAFFISVYVSIFKHSIMGRINLATSSSSLSIAMDERDITPSLFPSSTPKILVYCDFCVLS